MTSDHGVLYDSTLEVMAIRKFLALRENAVWHQILKHVDTREIQGVNDDIEIPTVTEEGYKACRVCPYPAFFRNAQAVSDLLAQYACDLLAFRFWRYIATGTAWHFPVVQTYEHVEELLFRFAEMTDKHGRPYAFIPKFIVCAIRDISDIVRCKRQLQQKAIWRNGDYMPNPVSHLQPLYVHSDYIGMDQFYMILPETQHMPSEVAFMGDIQPYLYRQKETGLFAVTFRGHFVFEKDPRPWYGENH